MHSCVANQSTQQSVQSMAKELTAGAKSAKARFGFITCTVGVDLDGLRAALVQEIGEVPFVGVTSCRSVIGAGKVVKGPRAAAAMWFGGDDVKAAVAAQSVSAADDAVGRQLARKALSELGGGASFALFHGTPGTEEPLLRGLQSELKTIPLLGGSAADDAIAGQWSVFTPTARYTSGAVLAVVKWPGKVAAPWVSGAMPAAQKGVVTKATGRTIHEIDGKPAAAVYNEWLGGALTPSLGNGEQILSKTTLNPLGVLRATGITLVHPERFVNGKSISTFAEVSQGETVALVRSTSLAMQGRPANLVSRTLTDAAIKELKGVLLIYCAGCMLAIDPATGAMVEALKGVTGSAPLAGSFNFGEQGCHVAGKPEHGNLMTGALLLG
jgi:hypothetical protein